MKSALLAAVLLQGCLASPIAHQQLTFAVPDTSSLAFSTAAAVLSSLSVPSLQSLSSTLPSDHYSQLAEHVASLPERRKVALLDSDGRLVQLDITEGEKALIVYAGIKFDDVTETHAMPADAVLARSLAGVGKDDDASFPSKWHYGKDKLQKLLYIHIDKDRMLQRLKKFTSFRTRYYRSNDGKQSQKWLLETVRSVAASAPKLNIDVTEFPHHWGQNSIIAYLPIGNRSQTSRGKVIIGAHQDSTNMLPFLSAPGADDDASGSITVLEVFSIIAEAKWQPETYDVEFHWYSAEEGGMLGSNAIAADYAAKMRQGEAEDSVRAMLQMDMTAYIKPGTEERIGIIEDFVNPELTTYVKGLTGEYTGIPSVDTKCGYACSDHSSWTKIGVPSAFAIEATFEDSNTGAIHSSRDTIDLDGYSLDHITRFVRLSAAFAVELST